MISSILAAVVILAVLIVVHEAGHFAMAKRLGVRVLRFSIGYPPRLWGIRHRGTDYAFGMTPLGGYVRMLGDEVAEEPKAEELGVFLREIELDLVHTARKLGLAGGAPSRRADTRATAAGSARGPRPNLAGDEAAEKDEAALVAESLRRTADEDIRTAIGRTLRPEETLLLDEIQRHDSAPKARESLIDRRPPELLEAFRRCAFPTQKLGKRVLIILAGPMANLLFAPLLLTGIFMYGVPQLKPIVGQVKQGMPAEKAGLKSGDRIVSIDGQSIDRWRSLSTIIKASDGSPLKIEFERKTDGSIDRGTVVVRPVRRQVQTAYGTPASAWIIGVMSSGQRSIRRVGPFRAVYEAFVTSGTMAVQMTVGLWQIVAGRVPVRQALGGPIMIAQMAGRQAREGLAAAAMFMVMLSIELGIINLLPVPLLDGGHLLFFAFEGVRGKPIDLRHREIALQLGLLVLVALMAFVIFNDISRIVQG